MSPGRFRFSTAALEGLELHALSWGDETRPTLVLLHGGGANAHWWDHLAPILAQRFHVVALDFRGHGDSDHTPELRPGAFERDLEALLEHLGSEEVHLVGHSMGGHVALSHASRVVATRSVVAIEAARGGARRENRRTRLALAVRRTYPAREEAVARFRFLPPSPRAAESLRTAIAEHSVREEPGGRWGFKFDPRWFSLPRGPAPDLARVASPALVIRGAESALLTAAGMAELVSELPQASGVEIADAGHNVHLERPEEVLEALERFFAERA